MTTVTAQDLQRDPLALVRRDEAGEPIIVMRDEHAVAEMRPTSSAARSMPRPRGLARGEFVVPDDFDAPLPDEILRDFERQ